jgi:hypothetical protein
MSVLADFYLAAKDAAAAYDEMQQCAEDDRVQSNRITPFELSMLMAILERKAWHVDLMDQFEQILIVDGGERLIHQVAPALVERLACLSTEGVSDAAVAWSAKEAIACAPDEIQPLVEDLARLAVRAQATGRQMFLWNCV